MALVAALALSIAEQLDSSSPWETANPTANAIIITAKARSDATARKCAAQTRHKKAAVQ